MDKINKYQKMTQFVVHQQYQNFPLFRIYNHNYIPKPQLKINNIKIAQPSLKRQKQQYPKLKNQIHSSQKNKYTKGRTNLISRTIQLISTETKPHQTIGAHHPNFNQANKKLVTNRTSHASAESSTYRKVTSKSKGRNLSSLQDYNNLNEDFNDKKIKRYQNQSNQHFQNAFKPARIRIGQGHQKKTESQVLSLSFLRYKSSEKTYTRFVQRSIKLAQQRHKRHTFNRKKSRQNTTQINYQKNSTEIFEPW